MIHHTQPPLHAIATTLVRERERQGLSISEVARRASIGKSTLSQLESGIGNPSIETLWSLCVALNISFASLLEPEKEEITFIRCGEGIKVSAEHANYDAILLAGCAKNSRRDIYTVIAQPGKDRVSQPHMSGVIEHVILISGKARVGTLKHQEILSPGDYISYPGDKGHILSALEPNTIVTMIIEHN